jgi:hypothetical protein
MKIEIPDIPASLNPKGWEVELSMIGERKEGLWPLFYYPEEKKWSGNYCPMWDSTKEIRARLIEPEYLFNGELKTESECLAILERDYECFPDCGKCEGCPFQIVGEPCLLPDSLQAWRKKQPAKLTREEGIARLGRCDDCPKLDTCPDAPRERYDGLLGTPDDKPDKPGLEETR